MTTPSPSPRLRSLLATRPGVSIPPHVDESLHRAIESRFASVRRGRRRRVGSLARLAAAIAVIAGAAVVARLQAPSPVAEDVDGNGVVNILDAWALDRRVRRGDAPTRLDLNGDGRVDAADVRAVARLAVSLDGRAG